ncbi:MAG: DUF2723 domain-containing protein [Salinivirgaceae bacterium]|nr:DUF2723 domain-containing protein [Salinivirgaceae bacterium]
MIIKRTSNLIGGLVFLFSLTIYLLTLEPTTNFWDCSEFITCAYNLEVGHAPGAPFFMIIGRIASLFAGNNPERVALMINGVSALMSAFTVLFLYLTIVWFIKKILSKTNREFNLLLVYGSAFIGAMAYAVSDSFWFSAVEGEVYATSSMFSALVFWCMIKYDEAEKGWNENRWIVFIFFLLGISVGVHLLNILAFPAMALIYYHKKFKPTNKGVLLSILLSSMLMLFFIFGLIPGVVKFAAYADLLFVNGFHLPVYSGAFFLIILIAIGLYVLFKREYKKHELIKKLAVLSFIFWLLGYSSFTILIIRSNQNPFVDINNVENIFGLVDYLNREQYPSRPLVYGNNFNSPVLDSKKRFNYKLHDGKYYRDELNPTYIFDDNTMTLFPRMASMEERHQQAYKNWVAIKGRKVMVRKRDGSEEFIQVPTFIDNLKFFFKYQLNHMYWRYFMWNFAGKQNDIQGYGNKMDGNWISGLPFYDNLRLGDQSLLPDFYKNHKARNAYYMLPFLLGFIGMFYHFKKDKNNFLVAMLLFLLTGISIVIYLNEVPITPRERDYVHVGSFYVFAIWMGLGAFALLQNLQSLKYKNIFLSFGLLFIAILVPANMLYENWDDHDRSDRFTARDYAKNILSSCDKNAILFTTADNDTYPIWYLQEVEKFRPDIREVLLTFLPVDWYADQLQINHPEKGSIPISFKGTELLMSKNQYFPVLNKVDSFVDVSELIDFVRSPDKRTKVTANDGSQLSFIPSEKMSLSVNVENFMNSCSYCTLNNNELPKELNFKTKKQYLSRDDLLILDMLQKNNWKRPVYFVYPHLLDNLGLSQYLHCEGMVYRLLPFKNNEKPVFEKANALFQYHLIKNEFVWGNVNKPEVYLDHTNIQMISSFRFRQMFAEAANQLSKYDEKQKAIELLDLAQELFSLEKVPYNYFMGDLLKAYYNSGAQQKADELAQQIINFHKEYIAYYNLNENSKEINQMQMNTRYYLIQQVMKITQQYSSSLYTDFVAELSE